MGKPKIPRKKRTFVIFNSLRANLEYTPQITPWSLWTTVTLDTVKIMKRFSCKSLKFATKW